MTSKEARTAQNIKIMTTNQIKLTALISDIRDCGRRARSLALAEQASLLHALADEMQLDARAADGDQPSLPPVLSSNQEIRATATKHFQKTREILRGIR